MFYFYFASLKVCVFSPHRGDLLSCIDKKVGKETPPLRLPSVRGLLAYSLKLCDSASMPYHKGSASLPRPAGFHLRLAKRYSRRARGYSITPRKELPTANCFSVAS